LPLNPHAFPLNRFLLSRVLALRGMSFDPSLGRLSTPGPYLSGRLEGGAGAFAIDGVDYTSSFDEVIVRHGPTGGLPESAAGAYADGALADVDTTARAWPSSDPEECSARAELVDRICAAVDGGPLSLVSGMVAFADVRLDQVGAAIGSDEGFQRFDGLRRRVRRLYRPARGLQKLSAADLAPLACLPWTEGRDCAASVIARAIADGVCEAMGASRVRRELYANYVTRGESCVVKEGDLLPIGPPLLERIPDPTRTAAWAADWRGRTSSLARWTTHPDIELRVTWSRALPALTTTAQVRAAAAMDPAGWVAEGVGAVVVSVDAIDAEAAPRGLVLGGAVRSGGGPRRASSTSPAARSSAPRGWSRAPSPAPAHTGAGPDAISISSAPWRTRSAWWCATMSSCLPSTKCCDD